MCQEAILHDWTYLNGKQMARNQATDGCPYGLAIKAMVKTTQAAAILWLKGAFYAGSGT